MFEGVSVNGEKDFIDTSVLNISLLRKRKTNEKWTSLFMAVVVSCLFVAKPTTIEKDKATDELNRRHGKMKRE